MNHLSVAKKLDKIATDNKEFFEIPTEQIGNEVVQYCQENDIEPDTEEFVAIMDHMGLELIHGMMMQWEMTKLKIMSKYNTPSDNKLGEL